MRRLFPSILCYESFSQIKIIFRTCIFRFERLFFCLLQILNKKMYDLFISYNWGIKTQVRQLCKVLKSLNYKVWMDETDLNAGSSTLTAELATAIQNSNVFFSCITTDYCRSFNCNRKIEYASA